MDRIYIYVAFCLGLLGCDSAGELGNAHYRWQQATLSNYSVLQTRSCECAPPYRYRLVVRDGQVVEVQDPETEQPLITNAKDLAIYWSIDELFARLEEWKADDPAVFRVQYHPEWGYPTDVFIDLDADAADEEIILTLSDLRLE